MLDTFEPSYIRAGLEKNDNLGSLIFGAERWQSHGGDIWAKNPLLEYFRRRNARGIQNFFQATKGGDNNTYLTSSSFSPLFLEGKALRTSWMWTRYFKTNNKEMWEIHPAPYWSVPAQIAQTKSYVFFHGLFAFTQLLTT